MIRPSYREESDSPHPASRKKAGEYLGTHYVRYCGVAYSGVSKWGGVGQGELRQPCVG